MQIFAFMVEHPLGAFIGFVAAHEQKTVEAAARKKWGTAAVLLQFKNAEAVNSTIRDNPNLRILF